MPPPEDGIKMDEGQDHGQYRLFFKQEAALEYIKSAEPEVLIFSRQFRIFSREKKPGGSRVHQVYPSCQHFCEAYGNYEDSYKTFFEVIPVGYPAKLYFDLEFQKDRNPNSNNLEMVEILLKEVRAALQRDFPDHVTDSSHIIKLDASTPAKFSQHLIFPKVVFRHLVHTKMFIERLCCHITQCLNDQSADHQRQKELKKLQIKAFMNGKEVDELFVDRSVYGKKQNFRIFQSCKFGKPYPLLRAAGELTEKSDDEVLLESLITNTSSANSPSFLEYPDSPEFQRYAGAPKPNASASLSGQCPSPFPEVDKFFLEIIREGGLSKSWIQRWEYRSDTKALRLLIGGDYRYCENIAGNHAEYGVFFIVYLTTREYVLRCLCPSCGRYCPQARSLPEELALSVSI